MDVIASAVLIGLLTATHFVPAWVLALFVGNAVGIWWFARSWRRNELEWLRRRLASASLAWMAGTAGMSLAALQIGIPPVVMVIAVVGIVLAVRARRSIAGNEVPTSGEPAGRLVFEGKAHALRTATQVPGTDIPAILWVARQGKRRWASTSRIELRSGSRAVRIDPAHAEIRDDAWLRFTTGLDGVDPAQRVALWYVPASGAHYIAVGTVTLEPDTSAPALRDPELVPVFTGAVTLRHGYRSLIQTEARTRLVLASLVGVAALASQIATTQHWW